MTLDAEQRKQLRRSCELIVPGFAAQTAAEEFRQVAEWCEHHAIEHDDYGSGELVESFERKVAALLGKPASTFMPSGIMAQLAAVRIWCESAGLQRFGMHPTSHLAAHEEEAYSALMHLHAVPIGDRLRPMLASDLEKSRQPLACLIVELPIREAGGQLPTWDALAALHDAARARSIRMHMDGARLWESAAFYDKTFAEIAAPFDSVYVSLYKGIGSFAGAMLAGDESFIAQARLWRRRMGGTLYHLSPMIAAASMRFDERIAMMPSLYARTLTLAEGLRGIAGLRVNPAVPHTNMLHLFFDADAEAVKNARDKIAAATRCWLFGGVQPAEVPGWSVTEIYVGDNLLHADNVRVLQAFSQLAQALREP